MSTYTSRYPKSYWDPVIINYIGLKLGKAYYKNYVYKCLITKLNTINKTNINYYRFKFDDEFQNIIKEKINTNYVWRYSSRSGLNNLLSYFRSNVPIQSTSIYVINFNENGNNIQNVLI